MRWLQREIKECISTHGEACQMTIASDIQIDDANGSVPLPDRVLDVTNGRIRLKETKGQSGSYIALSYCWGSSGPFCTTTNENYEERIRDIALDQLPQTLADAVTVTRKLGKAHLWIDALCIIQACDNDPQGRAKRDWESQAKMMGRIYSLAFLTISATGASSPAEGLFNCGKSPAFHIDMPYNSKKSWAGKTTVKGTFQARLSTEDFEKSVERSPLAQRGWVLQERLLSRRMIYFTKSRLYFECQSMIPISENGDVWRNYLANDYAFSRMEVPSSLSKAMLSSGGFKMHVWYYIVFHYTRLSLTQETDRSAAIQGMVFELQELIRTRMMWKRVNDEERMFLSPEYCWGIWLGDIFRGLLWRSASNVEPKAAGNGAPSFSWLALSTPVTYPPHIISSLDWNIQKGSDDNDSRVSLITPQLSKECSPVKRDHKERSFLGYKHRSVYQPPTATTISNYERSQTVFERFLLLPQITIRAMAKHAFVSERLLTELEIQELKSLRSSDEQLASIPYTGCHKIHERNPNTHEVLIGSLSLEDSTKNLPSTREIIVVRISRNVIKNESGQRIGPLPAKGQRYQFYPYTTWNVLALVRVDGEAGTYVRVGCGEIIFKDWFEDVKEQDFTLV